MSVSLRMSDSPDKCSNLTRRHIRRCGKAKGAETLATNIKGKHENLKSKKAEVAIAIEEVEDAYDNADFQAEELDNTVRDSAGRAKEIDRKTPGSSLFARLFPDGINEVIRTNREKEPDVVDQIAILIENLGSEHELFPFAAKLREEAQKSRDANNAYLESLKKLNTLKTELDIAKSELITQYQNNILDAQKLFGKEYADRLFSKSNSAGPEKDNNTADTTKDEKSGTTVTAG
jgi:hypothetical protein